MLIELPIYCFMLIELILKVSVDELYWNWLNYMLLLRYVELEMKIYNMIVMWMVIEKWWNWKWICWIVWIWMTCWQLIDLCLLLRMMWLWNMLSWEMRWGWDIEICWWWKNDLSYWECGLKFVELDWIDELCKIVCVWW